MKPKYFLFLFLTLTIIHQTSSIATVRYVSKTGTSTPPFLSWNDAADSIQKCINICSFGDTVYVGNGIYKEQVIMIPGLSLIGTGTDSCVIDTQELVTSQNYNSVIVADSCLLTGFHINIFTSSLWGRINAAVAGGNGNNIVTMNKITNGRRGIVTGLYTNVYKNIFSNVSVGAEINNSRTIFKNNIIFTDPNSQATIVAGLYLTAIDSNYIPIIDSNYIEVIRGTGIEKGFGSNPIITNNFIKPILSTYGIASRSTSGTVKVFNNLIYTDSGYIGIYNGGTQYLISYNNYLSDNFNTGIDHSGPFDIIKNNVITNAVTGISTWSTPPVVQYNNVWNTTTNYSGFIADSTNISVDPMVVNDDTTQGELDFHLQKYSPLIDTGDPNILDRDGSRSDIGLYGGPYGWTYTYNDLAPRPPHNVTAVNENGLIKLTWNKNTEADFSHYRIYRDTVSILIYDSTRVVGVTSDTVFYDNLPSSNTEKNYYYLITAFDYQKNQSAPSEQINVTITGLSEHPPIGFDGYALLSNYPNPFNPSTIIPYRLKESGYVKLYIYDIKGELVRTLVNQWQSSGYYEVVFQPNADERKKASSLEVPMGRTYSDMSSGVYLYQIIVRGEGDIPVFSDMGKMILMK